MYCNHQQPIWVEFINTVTNRIKAVKAKGLNITLRHFNCCRIRDDITLRHFNCCRIRDECELDRVS